MTLQNAVKLVRENKNNPGELVNIRLELSAEYGFLSEKLGEILIAKASSWKSLREQSKSATEAEKLWESSDFGRDEIRLRLQLKSFEKLMSAIRTKLEMSRHELFNQY